MVFDVALLVKQFLCGTPLNKLTIKNLRQEEYAELDWYTQKKILDNTLNCALVKKYPIKKNYQRAFLKLLIEKLEESNIEINDELYTAYGDLVSSTDNNESIHYRHYWMGQNKPLNCITLQESTNIISEGTTGLASWQGALALAEWCTKHNSEFNGKTILELGCGVGLTGLTVINTCQPKRYIFSDCHCSVLKMVYKNVQLNLIENERKTYRDTQASNPRVKLEIEYGSTIVDVIELKWEGIEDYVSEDLPTADVIIGADILYESRSFGALISTLQTLLIPKNTYAIIAATVRNEETISQFLEKLGDYNLMFEQCLAPKQSISIQLSDSEVRILKIFNKR